MKSSCFEVQIQAKLEYFICNQSRDSWWMFGSLRRTRLSRSLFPRGSFETKCWYKFFHHKILDAVIINEQEMDLPTLQATPITWQPTQPNDRMLAGRVTLFGLNRPFDLQVNKKLCIHSIVVFWGTIQFPSWNCSIIKVFLIWINILIANLWCFQWSSSANYTWLGCYIIRLLVQHCYWWESDWSGGVDSCWKSSRRR